MKFTKDMIKSCTKIIVCYNPRITKAGMMSGFFKYSDYFYIWNYCSAVRLNDFKEEVVQAIENTQIEYQNGKGTSSKAIIDIFKMKDDADLYSENHVVEINIKSLHEEIVRTKKTEEYKKMGVQLLKGNQFGVAYNKNYMLNIAKCLSSKQATVYFPNDRKKPIFIVGTFGIGVLLPCCY